MAQPYAPIHSLPRSRRGSAASQSSRGSVSSQTVSSHPVAVRALGSGSSTPLGDPLPPDRSRTPSPAMEALPETVLTPSPSPPGPVTSTPHRSRSNSGLSYNSVEESGELTASSRSQPSSEEKVEVPVMGYEVMEERSRFTVFKLKVQRSEQDHWILFRRYTDFARLNDQLREMYPKFRLALPPKKWFGDNFDPMFLDDRMRGLEAFLVNITNHPDISKSTAVRTFLCLDEPPGQHETLEESRALCESMEETIYDLQHELAERDCTVGQLEEQIEAQQQQIEALTQALRDKCNSFRREVMQLPSTKHVSKSLIRKRSFDRVTLQRLTCSTCHSLLPSQARRDSTASAPGVVGAVYSPQNSPVRQLRLQDSPRHVSEEKVSKENGLVRESPLSGARESPLSKEIRESPLSKGTHDTTVEKDKSRISQTAQKDRNNTENPSRTEHLGGGDATVQQTEQKVTLLEIASESHAETENKDKATEQTDEVEDQNATSVKKTQESAALATPGKLAPNDSQGSIGASPAVQFFIGTPLGTSLPKQEVSPGNRRYHQDSQSEQ